MNSWKILRRKEYYIDILISWMHVFKDFIMIFGVVNINDNMSSNLLYWFDQL